MISQKKICSGQQMQICDLLASSSMLLSESGRAAFVQTWLVQFTVVRVIASASVPAFQLQCKSEALQTV